MSNIGNKHIYNLKEGTILLSKESLDDPNFKLTIILISGYNDDGTFGFILNRPSHMPLSEVFDIESEIKNQHRTIYIGGPVEQETLHIIQLTDTPVKSAYQISENVYLGGEWNSLEEILKQDSSTTRIFLGYSGWAGGQLEKEIDEGVWELYNVDVNRFLKHWEEPIYNDIDSIREYLLRLEQES